ncbi:hypothetical protein DERF_013707 [Dermatophagoides farinae]|uniref:Uncharacterized protein n=1 Tax=Dermatophagoides farinae TaxID=6954 RepID=A0A922KVR3_DERFA|nr:hypothetical protein DERF_013707 [Dermatophagoides farinae]
MIIIKNNNNENKDAIIVPLVDTKSISIIKSNDNDHHHHHHHHHNNHHHGHIDPKEQAILLHEFHNHHHHPNLPHKIIIEEDDDDDDGGVGGGGGDFDDEIDNQTPMTIIRERESFVHAPEIVKIAHHYPSSLNPNQIHGHIRGNGAPILVHLVAPNIRRKQDSSIPDLLAVLAPLAAIPLIGSLAVSSFTTMLTLTGLGRRRRRRRRRRDLSLHDKVLNFLNSSNAQIFDDVHDMNINNNNHHHHSYMDQLLNNNSKINQYHQWNNDTIINNNNGDNNNNNNNQTTRIVPISELFQLDIVQQYLRQSGRPDHNDEIIANYLSCRGMFSSINRCLERLACHYGDQQNGRLRPLERDVAALIIYSLLRNSHIDNTFKRRLQRAALFGYDHTSSSSSGSSGSSSSSMNNNDEPSFIAVCDREFPCPRSEMP